MWRVAARVPALRVDEGNGGLLNVTFGNVEVPAQPNGNFWLYASPPDRERFVSADAVLSGRLDPERNNFV